MPNKNISDFLTKFDGGARPNLFEVTFTGGPDPAIDGEKLSVHCKAASLPSSILGVINLNYRGRIIQLPGDRTFEDWTITVINDEAMSLKKAFVKWQASYNDHVTNQPVDNVQLYGSTGKIASCTATVSQLSRTGTPTMTYELGQVWCDNVSGTDVSYDTPDTVSEFTVTLKYHSYTITDTPAV